MQTMKSASILLFWFVFSFVSHYSVPQSVVFPTFCTNNLLTKLYF